MRAHGPEGTGAGGREPGAVFPPVRHRGKVMPLFGIKLMSIKKSYNAWICEHAGKCTGVENGIKLLEGSLAA